MASKNNSDNTTKTTKFRTNYDADFKCVVVKYAIQTSNKAASDHFGINESNIRRWKRLSGKADLIENTIGRKTLVKKTRKRRKTPGRSRWRKLKTSANIPSPEAQENSSDIGMYAINKI